ncbi:MAG TPA: glycoside hydrolase family 76 protein [Solirubrobacteraceae bacterium]|nr:glycoside hydrolase family 76 protein [Solirubrobacteraceae bacterium]
MTRRLVIVALAMVGALLAAAPAPAVIGEVPLPDAGTLASQRAQYLSLAELGLRQAHKHWWNARLGWYDDRKQGGGPRPLVSLWGAVPLFQAVNAVAIADPTPANLHAADAFATGAERYLNPSLRPVAGFGSYPGLSSPERAWFDDNGWWGLNFLDAFRATGNPRFVRDAQRAFRFIAVSGWDGTNGGLWWDTAHSKKAGESLASATLLAALLYQQTGSPYYAAQARKFFAWGDTSFWNPEAQLYRRTETSPTPMPYVEVPMLVASALLCRIDGTGQDCQRAAALDRAFKAWFPPEADMGPQFDAVYLRWLLEAYTIGGDPQLYAIADYNTQRALQNGRFDDGLFGRAWDGGSVTAHDATADMLRIQGAGVSVLAWLAATPGPA